MLEEKEVPQNETTLQELVDMLRLDLELMTESRDKLIEERDLLRSQNQK